MSTETKATQHTKGPWTVSDYYTDGTRVLGADGFPVADVADTAILEGYDEKVGVRHWAEAPGKAFIERPAEEVEANRHLVAAAPDLLAACDDALSLVSGIEDGDHFKPSEIRETRELLQAAIVKALGREG